MSNNLLELLKEHLSGDVVSNIATLIGESPKNTESALQTALPSLLAGLVDKCSDETSIDKLFSLITEGNHDGGVLSNLGALSRGGEETTKLLAEGGHLLTTFFGDKAAGVIIAVGMSLFALATVLGWSLYGIRCTEYLFGIKSVKVYQFIYVLVVVAGATMDLNLIWQISDTLNGLMAIPNLIAVLALSGVVVKLTKEHFEGKQRL